MNILSIIIIVLSIIYIIFISYIFLISKKINKLESKIKLLFNQRTDTIPSLYNSTKGILNKHKEIFEKIISLRKIEYNQIIYNKPLDEIIYNEGLIHHELNFILRICDKNNRLLKKERFNYTKEIIYNKSIEIGDYINTYKKIIKIYNKLIFIKNISIIGIFFPLRKKVTI